MTSEKDQSSNLQLTELQQLTQEVQMLRLEKQAMAELIWNSVRKAFPDSHEVVVPLRPTDDLWMLAFSFEAEGSSNVRILAGTIPPITDQEKKRVVRFLKGTAHGMEVALAEFKLDHPAHYVASQISEHLVFKDGIWTTISREKATPTC